MANQINSSGNTNAGITNTDIKTVETEHADAPERPDGPVRWLVGGSVLATVIVLFGGVPLGVPGEWVWRSIPVSAVTLVAGLMLLGLGSLILACAEKSAPWYAAGSWRTRIVLASLLAMVSFAWFSVAREPVDWLQTAAGRSRDPWVLYSPGASGYFLEARKIESTAAWLASYEQQVASGDHLHQGTHPPGLILCYRALLITAERFPALVNAAHAAMSSPVRESFVALVATQSPTVTRRDVAVLWWAAVLTQAALAASVVPILWIAAQLGDRSAAWKTAALWMFVPAGVLFLPKSDCLYPLCLVLVLATWTRALGGNHLAAFAAGIVASCSLWLSLALGPAYAGIAVGSIVFAYRQPDLSWGRFVKTSSIAILGGVIPLGLAAACGLNLVAVWAHNLKNHAAFYDHFPRTYAAWLPANAVEAFIACGPAIFGAAIYAAFRAWQQRATQSGSNDDGATTLLAGIAAAWALLWISGKNMGEAARLWTLFTPIPLLLTAMRPLSGSSWRWLAGGTLLAFVMVQLRVIGFDLTGQ